MVFYIKLCFAYINQSVCIWVWPLWFKSIGWVNVIRIIFDVGSSYVGSEISNYFEKLKKLTFIVYDTSHSQSMTQIKPNREKQEDSGVCDLNHHDSNHATLWLKSQVVHDSNHISHVSHCLIWFESHLTHDLNHTVFHFFLFGSVQFDSNHNFYLIWIMILHDSNHRFSLTWITWNCPLLLCWSCSTQLVHLNQINKCSWLESNIFFTHFVHNLKHLYKSFPSFTLHEFTDYHFSFLTIIIRMIIVMIIIFLKVFLKTWKPTIKKHLLTFIICIWTHFQPLTKLTSSLLLNS